MIDKIENTTIYLATLIGVANIESILGIIMLLFQIILILTKVFIKIHNSIINKKSVDINEEIDEFRDIMKEVEISDEIRKDR